jgi:hypothetical protein
VIHTGKKVNEYKVPVEKPDGKKPLAMSLKDNIRMYISKTGWDVTVWIHLVQDKDKCWNLVNTVSMSNKNCREFTLKWESHSDT